MKFNNLKEIQQHYQKQLAAGNTAVLNDVKNKSGKTIDQILIFEAERLRDCVQKYIDEYYNSYSPRFYERTEGLKNAFTAETKVSTEGGQKYIGLYFDDTLSWGQSVVTGELNGWKPHLIDSGWKQSNSTPSFEGYEGFGFIEKGIAEWEATLTNKNIEVKRIGSTGKS